MASRGSLSATRASSASMRGENFGEGGEGRRGCGIVV